MGNVSDEEEEEKQPSPLKKELDSDNYLGKLSEILKQVKGLGKPISF